jgi:hypothetical protein
LGGVALFGILVTAGITILGLVTAVSFFTISRSITLVVDRFEAAS